MTDWMQWAACVNADADTFFPEKGESAGPAKRICSGCEVRQECLDWSLSLPSDTLGIWGGLSYRERKLVRSMVGNGVKPPAECGTPSGYQRHHRLGEQSCDPCREARNEQKNAWRREWKRQQGRAA